MEILIATVKFFSNIKILDTELFFFIPDLPTFVKGKKPCILNKQICLAPCLLLTLLLTSVVQDNCSESSAFSL